MKVLPARLNVYLSLDNVAFDSLCLRSGGFVDLNSSVREQIDPRIKPDHLLGARHPLSTKDRGVLDDNPHAPIAYAIKADAIEAPFLALQQLYTAVAVFAPSLVQWKTGVAIRLWHAIRIDVGRPRA